MDALFVAALVMVVFGMLCLLAAYRLRQAMHPTATIDFADETYEVLVPRGPLIDPQSKLTGQADSLLRIIETQEIAPVRVVNEATPEAISEGLRVEILALCLLVEQSYGSPPPYGVLRFTDQDVTLAWDAAMRAELQDLIQALRADEGSSDVPRSHDDEAICAACPVRDVCDQRLA